MFSRCLSCDPSSAHGECPPHIWCTNGLPARAKNRHTDWAMSAHHHPGPDRHRTAPPQIATRLRAAIAAGALAPGARLPSARALADQLGVARGTVDAAMPC